MDPVNVPAKFELRSFTLLEIIASEVKFWLRTPYLGKEEAVQEVGDGVRKSVLLCPSTPLCPTPPLVFPKFPYVALGVGGMWDGLWAANSEGVGLIDRAISFRDFQLMWS